MRGGRPSLLPDGRQYRSQHQTFSGILTFYFSVEVNSSRLIQTE
uniref:Uncharacterized protein n=1 Tax=Anguilla anguilla TaxID=7936 RepID=A0A0E9UQY1_ANGAN